jgi:phosphoenolpyruvate-protein kinase (PTS system EI component)
LGGDKFVAGGPIATARSAFHRYRAMRVFFDYPDVLRDQVQALALAAADRPLRILIPMVTSIAVFPESARHRRDATER